MININSVIFIAKVSKVLHKNTANGAKFDWNSSEPVYKHKEISLNTSEDIEQEISIYVEELKNKNNILKNSVYISKIFDS